MTSPSSTAIYGSKRPTTPRAIAELESTTGPITKDAAGLNPSDEECYELLRAEWPLVTYWYNLLFPHFAAPASASQEEAYMIKAQIWLWILRYSGTVMNTDPLWAPIIEAFNAPASKWGKYLAWNGSTPGFTIDGKTVRAFPSGLAESLGNIELRMFNSFSSLCDIAMRRSG